MRICLICSTDELGPFAAFSLPDGPLVASDSVAIVPVLPGALHAITRAWFTLRLKGTDLSWNDWADQLVSHSPYFESWAVAEVPEDTSLPAFLEDLRIRWLG